MGGPVFGYRDVTQLALFSVIKYSWETVEDTFERRREIIEMIDLWVTLSVQDGQKVADVRCHLGSGSFRIAPRCTP
jgi:hypothetical protein